MKKRAIAILLCGCLAFASCGKDNTADSDKGTTPTPATQEKEPTVTPEGGTGYNSESESAYWMPKGEVTLGKYIGIEVEKVVPTVSDEEIAAEIDYFLENNTEYQDVTDHDAVMEEDTAQVSYSIVVGDETVDEDEDVLIEVGYGEYDFEEQLIGMKVGDSKEFEQEITDDYYEDYVGQKAKYSIKVTGIVMEVKPELTDETVAAHTDYATVEEYKQSIYESLMTEAKYRAEDEQTAKMFEKLMEESKFTGIDEADVQSYVDETINYYTYYASMWGIDVKELIQLYFDSPFEDFEKQVKQEGEYVVKQYLILDAIVKAENITVSEQEYKDSLAKYADEYGYDTPEETEEMLGKDEIMRSLLRDKAYSVMVDTLIVK